MTKPKSRRKSNTQQEEATNPNEFSFNITRVAVAQICNSVGFRRSQVTALRTLTLVATKYLETLARSAASFSNAANRGKSNLLDITTSSRMRPCNWVSTCGDTVWRRLLVEVGGVGRSVYFCQLHG
ncbi:transcription initiation factor TFIID subunit 8-like [Hibiscus syriacus]|uniref:transcription initiation factor TFIID subunit 8-like n=1 Tax=Hibiscus syriacus TaxID=106335 RepID=UPI001922B11F|nr:transcription initiation factor TFIID subunit 8-like [Hibiscus syriacus]